MYSETFSLCVHYNSMGAINGKLSMCIYINLIESSCWGKILAKILFTQRSGISGAVNDGGGGGGTDGGA